MFAERSVDDALVNDCSADHEFAVVVPNASEIVFAVFTSGYVNARVDCLLLKVLQSVAERRPRESADAVGILRV